MKPLHLRILGAASLAGALLAGSAASALTANDVWTSFQNRIAGLGQTVTVGSQSTSGGTLSLKQVSSTATGPKGKAVFTIPEIDLAEGSDGSVTVTLPQKATVSVSGTDDKGGTVDLQISIDSTTAKSLVTGSLDDMTVASTAPTLVIALDSLKADGKDIDATANMTLAGLDSTAHLTGSDPETVDSKGTLQSLKLLVDGKDPEGKGSLHLEGGWSDLSSASKITIPKTMDLKNLAASLAAGYAVVSNVTYGPGTLNVDVTDPQGPSKITGSMASGTFSTELDKDHLTYGGTGKDTHFTLASPSLPFPQIELSEAESDFNLLLPAAKSDTPQNFALLLKAIGLSVNQEVWQMADPNGVLPHDPATLIVDLAGTATPGFSLFDPTLAEHPPTDPGKLNSLKLNQLQLTAAGADLTGTGAVTFDNSAGPVPKPVGAVDLKLTGGNGLIDKLIKMGLIPQDQAMGFKMMLGMFAKPAGDDVMTSKIEFKDDGSILANGQRIQ